MRIDRKYKLDKLTAGESRQHIAHVYLDAEKSELRVTNGHAAVIVPCEVAKDDVSGPLPLMRLARPEGDDYEVHAGKDAVSVKRPNVGAFPPLESVLPKFKEGDPGTFTVAFDPGLLAKVAAAMGDPLVIVMTFRAPEDIIRVSRSDEPEIIGAMMPCRR